MVDVGEVRIEFPLLALAARMTRCDVEERWSHPFVSFSASHCVAMKGRSASAFFSLVSCGAVFIGSGRLFPDHWRNQTRANLST